MNVYAVALSRRSAGVTVSAWFDGIVDGLESAKIGDSGRGLPLTASKPSICTTGAAMLPSGTGRAFETQTRTIVRRPETSRTPL